MKVQVSTKLFLYSSRKESSLVMRKNVICDNLIRFHKITQIACLSSSFVSYSVFLPLNTLFQNNMFYSITFIT